MPIVSLRSQASLRLLDNAKGLKNLPFKNDGIREIRIFPEFFFREHTDQADHPDQAEHSDQADHPDQADQAYQNDQNDQNDQADQADH